MHTALPIDDRMIKRHIEFSRDEYGEDIDETTAKVELERLRDRGCLLYDDCRSCPLYGKTCPF